MQSIHDKVKLIPFICVIYFIWIIKGVLNGINRNKTREKLSISDLFQIFLTDYVN